VGAPAQDRLSIDDGKRGQILSFINTIPPQGADDSVQWQHRG
jgi:hypothetical protein